MCVSYLSQTVCCYRWGSSWKWRRYRSRHLKNSRFLHMKGVWGSCQWIQIHSISNWLQLDSTVRSGSIGQCEQILQNVTQASMKCSFWWRGGEFPALNQQSCTFTWKNNSFSYNSFTDDWTETNHFKVFLAFKGLLWSARGIKHVHQPVE